MAKTCRNCKYLERVVENGIGPTYRCKADERFGDRTIPWEWTDQMNCDKHIYRKQNKLG